MENTIKTVAPHSPAARAGLRPGDVLLEINGKRVVDVLDYMFLSYDARLTLKIRRGGEEKLLKMRKDEGADTGVTFEEYLMDKPHACANNCIFCFVDQLPKGMRSTLYFKDDDVRLSFLTGSYITLTNLSEREIQRIIDLRITPINISVHTADPEKRCMMLGNRNAGRGLAVMERFAAAEIEMNCQIVCCPGINDGEELTRTMAWLEGLHPAVNSVSVIPVGLTKHREGLYPLRLYDRTGALATVRQVEAFADRCLAEHGSRIFFCSDEFYIKAGLPFPADECYEDYPQLENGVGILRLFRTEFDEAMNAPDAPAEASPTPFSIATGVAAAPFMRELLADATARYPALDGRVYAIRNDFFGESIDVAGLITGGDLIAQLKGRPLGRKLLITERMLRRGDNVFLDDVTDVEAAGALGVEIVKWPQSGADFFKILVDL